jgi:hypothetical protein
MNLKLDSVLILINRVRSIRVIATVLQSSVLDCKSVGRRRTELTVGVLKKQKGVNICNFNIYKCFVGNYHTHLCPSIESLEAMRELPRKNCYVHVFIVLFAVKWKDKDILNCTGHQVKRFPISLDRHTLRKHSEAWGLYNG